MVDIPISAPARMNSQVVVITGAAGGIGSEVARAFALAGATVIATDIGKDDPFADHQQIHYYRYDVTSVEETKAVTDTIIGEHGKINALILCAGSITSTTLAESTNDEWAQILQVNLMGVVNPLRHIYPLMCEQGGGKIVALGSIAAKIGGVASGPAYVAAKSAVHGLIKWTAKNGAAHGVFANIIAPGPVETPMWQNVTGREPPKAHGSVPLGRFGQPEDIAQAILFLSSPASNWITGTTLDVNGGMLMD